MPVIVEDGLEPAARQALEDALVADFSASFDLGHGPLLAAALLDRGTRTPRALLVVVHHLVFDAVSWSILAEDLVAALDPLARLPTSTAGFDAWCKTLERHAGTLDSEIAGWRGIEAQVRPILPRLVLSWGWYPERLTPAPEPARVRADLEQLRRLGFNGVKLCLWVPPESYLDICDELGMLVS